MAVEPFSPAFTIMDAPGFPQEQVSYEASPNRPTELAGTSYDHLPDYTIDDEDEGNSGASNTEYSEEENEADDGAARLWQIVRDDQEPMEEPDDLSDADAEESPDDQDGESELDDGKLVIDASALEADEELPSRPEAPIVPPLTPMTTSQPRRGVASPNVDSNGAAGLPPFHGLPPKLVISFKFKYNNAGSAASPSLPTKQQSASPVKSGNLILPPKWPATVHSPAMQSPMQRFSTPLRPLLPKPPSFELIPRSQFQKPPEPSGAPAHFPPKTVRRIMTFLTSTQDIRVSNPAVDAVAVALECFVRSFTQEAFRYAQRKKRTTLRYDDIAYIGNRYTNLHFLQDYLPAQEAAGYVVRKTLEESGVGFPKEILPAGPQPEMLPMGPPAVPVSPPLAKDVEFRDKSPGKSAKAVKKTRKAPYDKNPLVESALVLAIRWGEDVKLKKWHEMTRNSSKPKRQF